MKLMGKIKEISGFRFLNNAKMKAFEEISFKS
jgi:hypothetical protein